MECRYELTPAWTGRDPACRTTRYRKRLLALLREAGRERYLPANAFMLGYARIADHDRAFGVLERSLEDRDVTILFGIRDPMLDPLRSDPRGAALFRKHGLEL